MSPFRKRLMAAGGAPRRRWFISGLRPWRTRPLRHGLWMPSLLSGR